MRRRLLNIASVVCLVLCLVLMGLCVRSYWRYDVCAVLVSSSSFVGIGSSHGTIAAYRGQNAPGYFNGSWDLRSFTIVEPEDYKLNTHRSNHHGALGFGNFQGGTFFNVYAPYWFFILVFGALSALPQLRSPWRFSLRTLLIATTFVALVLGMIAWLDCAWTGK